jgi:hypothetical protein
MSEQRLHTESASREEKIVVGGSIIGEDFLKLLAYPNGFGLLMCKGLSVNSVTLTKKQLLDLAKRMRRFAHQSDEEQSNAR